MDFEQAYFYIDENQQPGFVSATNALPGWTVYLGTNQTVNVLYATVGHGGTLVDLLGKNSSILTDGLRSIEGSFSVMLQGGFDGISGSTAAAIRQTGLIPATARSIQFKAWDDIYFGMLSVSLNGISIPFFPLSSGPSYTVYGGDVSAFANRTIVWSSPSQGSRAGTTATGSSTQSGSPPRRYPSQASLPFPLSARWF